MAPYDAEDARGLMKAAIRDPDPVVVLESEILYNKVFKLSGAAQHEDFELEIGKAHVAREGSDVTIVSYSRGVDIALAAAEMLAQGKIFKKFNNKISKKKKNLKKKFLKKNKKRAIVQKLLI